MSWAPPKPVPKSPSYLVGQGTPTKLIIHAPCAYCGNEFQPANVFNCHGCGAPLKAVQLKAVNPLPLSTFMPPSDYSNSYLEVTTIGSSHKEYVRI